MYVLVCMRQNPRCQCFYSGPPRQMADRSPTFWQRTEKSQNFNAKNTMFNEHPVSALTNRILNNSADGQVSARTNYFLAQKLVYLLNRQIRNYVEPNRFMNRRTNRKLNRKKKVGEILSTRESLLMSCWRWSCQ